MILSPNSMHGQDRRLELEESAFVLFNGRVERKMLQKLAQVDSGGTTSNLPEVMVLEAIYPVGATPGGRGRADKPLTDDLWPLMSLLTYQSSPCELSKRLTAIVLAPLPTANFVPTDTVEHVTNPTGTW